MNKLIVGTNKADIFKNLEPPFLVIADDISTVPIPHRTKVTRLDVFKDSFNPLSDMGYKTACDFVSVLDAVFPEGENTLTKKASTLTLLKALLSHPKRLDKLPLRGKEPGDIDAAAKIERLLLSPVLKSFLCNARGYPTFSLDGIVLVRLDRTVLSDFDAFVIANVLISNFQGQVVVPDFGFYGCPFHTSLIRQERLIAGVNFLDETPLRNQLLLIKDKVARTCTTDDALVLAGYSGLLPHTNEHNDFLADAIA